jgi:hypothetical protein
MTTQTPPPIASRAEIERAYDLIHGGNPTELRVPNMPSNGTGSGTPTPPQRDYLRLRNPSAAGYSPTEFPARQPHGRADARPASRSNKHCLLS